MDDPVTIIADSLAEANGTPWDRMPSDPHDVYERDARAVVEALRASGYTIAYVSLCWCEGKANGAKHSPGCAELAREERSKRPTTPA